MVLLFLIIGTLLTKVSLTQQSLFDFEDSIKPIDWYHQIQRRSITDPPVRDSCDGKNDIFRTRTNTTDRLRRLRLRMKGSGYDAYIVPSVDEHQSEFIADHDKRREFISGFSGSAGTAVILSESAALWTDGRYYLQAGKELDCNWILMKRNEVGTPSISEWLIKHLKAGQRVGTDAKLVSYSEWMFLSDKLQKFGMHLTADESNLIDDIWDIPQGREPESVAHVTVHDIKYAGKTWQEKLEELSTILRLKNADGTILSALDEIAWLFNLRGGDVPFTPVFKAYALITLNQIKIYVKTLKVTPDIQQYLCPKSVNDSLCVEIGNYNEAFNEIEDLINETNKILLPSTSSFAVVNLVPEAKRIIDRDPSPVSVLKVVKNPIEISGMKNATLRDSVAIVDFIAMLNEQVNKGKHWDEIKAVKALTRYRREQKLNQGESFETISAFGLNAAVIHYHPQILTNRYISGKHVYLLDSGGQYLDGTTDITRTFHFGEPTENEVEAYTRVLMGAIDLLSAVFPENTKGSDLDILARGPLFQLGLDYQHGTGHGIGHFLSVHEGPIYIGKKRSAAELAFKPGMFLSDEPGYYEEGKFGIRLETMMLVVEARTQYHFDNLKFYTFEPISFVPFEPKLIDFQILTKKQKEWLNWYNIRTRNTVGIELKRQSRERGFQWLLSKTKHIPVESQCSGSGILFSMFHFWTVISLSNTAIWIFVSRII